jgi:hypothetical protein
MGEFRDMGIPAQAAKPRVQDFFLPRYNVAGVSGV